MLRDDFPGQVESDCSCPAHESAVLPAALPQMTGDRRLRQVALTVYYNGACPACRARVARYQSRAGARTRLIAWCDVAEAPWALARWQVGVGQALTTVHVLDRHGRLFSGGAAFARLWRELPGYRLMGWLASLPGARLIGQAIYRPAVAYAHAGTLKSRIV